MADKTENAKIKKEHEPLITITKRADVPLLRKILVRAGAILAALIVCGLITKFVTGDDPISVYVTMFKGAFGTPNKTWFTFQELAILLGVSLALCAAVLAGLFGLTAASPAFSDAPPVLPLQTAVPVLLLLLLAKPGRDD